MSNGRHRVHLLEVSGVSMLGRLGSVDSRAETRPPATVLARLKADSFAKW